MKGKFAASEGGIVRGVDEESRMVRLKAGACAVLIACVYLAVRAQPPARRPDNPGAQATKLHRNAESQFLSRRWGQAGPLLEQFIKEYPTHEHVPLAHLQLAHCAWRQGDPGGHEAALDEVIKRFPGSAAWFCAYGAKLKIARRQGDRERYLAVAGALLRRNGELPLTLSDDTSRTFKDYFSDEYYVNERVLPTHPRFATPPRSPRRKTYPWVLDLVWAGDTPDRARQVLRLMVRTLRNRDGELPCDWEFANVTLLRQSGQAEKAERTFQGYLKEWGDDPRAIGLWILRIRHALANEDSETAMSGYDHLVRTYPGYGSLVQLGIFGIRSSLGPEHDFQIFDRFFVESLRPGQFPVFRSRILRPHENAVLLIGNVVRQRLPFFLHASHEDRLAEATGDNSPALVFDVCIHRKNQRCPVLMLGQFVDNQTRNILFMQTLHDHDVDRLLLIDEPGGRGLCEPESGCRPFCLRFRQTHRVRVINNETVPTAASKTGTHRGSEPPASSTIRVFGFSVMICLEDYRPSFLKPFVFDKISHVHEIPDW